VDPPPSEESPSSSSSRPFPRAARTDGASRERIANYPGGDRDRGFVGQKPGAGNRPYLLLSDSGAGHPFAAGEGPGRSDSTAHGPPRPVPTPPYDHPVRLRWRRAGAKHQGHFPEPVFLIIRLFYHTASSGPPNGPRRNLSPGAPKAPSIAPRHSSRGSSNKALASRCTMKRIRPRCPLPRMLADVGAARSLGLQDGKPQPGPDVYFPGPHALSR